MRPVPQCSEIDFGGGASGRTPGVNYRSAERIQVVIPAELLNWESTNRNCVITDFSRNGMGVELSRRVLNDPTLTRWLSRGVSVSVGFMLPGSGRRVRAHADVMHVVQDGNRIRFGLHFPVSNATVMEAVMQAGRQMSGREALTQAGATLPAGNGVDVDEAAAQPAATWSESVRELCDHFLSESRQRLTAHSVGDPGDTGTFLGLVVFHNNEQHLRDLFAGELAQAPHSLREAMHGAISEMGLAPAVQELLLHTFDELLDSYPGSRSLSH